jgi:prepilin-type N-terminal cleavage/methylation domain-containing protein
MKVLRGFTLAEVLITMAIVGLIAALTLPTLNSNVQKSTVGPSLAKAINTLENANRLALQDNEVSTLSSITDGYPKGLTTYLNGTYYSQARIDSATKYDGEPASSSKGTLTGGAITSGVAGNLLDNSNKLDDIKVASENCIITQDGIIYSFSDSTVSTKIDSTSKYYGNYYSVTIDINGNKNPNTVGQDRFNVVVDLYGSVIPVGGRQYADYTGSSTVNWETTCPANETPTNYADCAGAIVDNSYKVMYTY